MNKPYSILKNLQNKEINKIYTFDKNKKIDYYDGAKAEVAERSENYEHNLHENERLQPTEFESRNEGGDTSREIRNVEVRLLEKTQEEPLQETNDGGQTSRTLNRSRENITRESINYHERDDKEREPDRRNEDERPNEMGRTNEQLQSSSRGSSNEGVNLRLESEDTKDSVLFSTEEKYIYKAGDKVFIDSNEYEIEKVGLFDVELYSPKYPLIGRTMNIVEFETKLKEDSANEHLKVIPKYNFYNETITEIEELRNKPLDDEYSYTVARVIDDENCVELHYSKDDVYVEIGNKIEEGYWENERVNADWFSLDLSNDDILNKLEEIFFDNFGVKELNDNENYYGEYNDEVDLVEHILNQHKIYDIRVNFNSNEEIVMFDDDNVWTGIEVYDFLDEIFQYNEDGTVDLVDNHDLERIKGYRKKYETPIVEKEEILSEKEKVLDNTSTNTQEQLVLFTPREQELADRLLDILNSFDTKWKGNLQIESVELKKWDHIKSNKRNLSIIISSNKYSGFDDNSFTQFNSNKEDEIILREGIENNEFIKYLNEDDDFSIYISPDLIHIYYSKFDEKQIDLSIGQDNVLQSINDRENITIIDDPEPLPVPKKTRKPRITNYVLHPEIPYDERINYKIKEDYLGVGTPKERFNNNIEAIKVIKKCEMEDRYATPEEQEVLSKYVGWGGLSESFRKDGSHQEEYHQLKSLLNEEEYNLAEDSTLTAFYTPPVVIDAMYKVLSNMGLKKGNILEPACGIGNFIGMLPNNDNLKIYGVEKDSISGKIARQLYQKSSIAIEGFENVEFSDSFFDVVIGNVPFGDLPINDKRYNKNHFVIHDYFFAKCIDKVRPGGIIALITSQGTLDKENSDVRKYIAARADLVGAIRLPNDTFKSSAGTTVTSDIIFLQKRDSITDIMPNWVEVGHDSNGLLINNYFIEHPDKILGEYKLISSQFGMKPACVPFENNNLKELLDEAVVDIQAEIKEKEPDEVDLEEDLSIEADLNVNNFSYTLVDDKVYYRENSRMYPKTLSVTAENRIKGLINLRDITRELINYQLEDYSDKDIEDKQAELNDLYDKFTKKYGLINSRANSSVFSDDNSYYLLCSLEILDDEGNLQRKADIFNKRTIKARPDRIEIKNAFDALTVSIGEKGKVDIEFMQNLCGLDMDKMLKDLEGSIFKVPEYGEPNHWVTADEYLSGNIREKLNKARKFAEDDKTFEVNVKYLEESMPKPLKAGEINVRIGTTWIPVEDYEDFIFNLFGSDYYARRNIKINYSEIGNEYYIEKKGYENDNEKVRYTYGTSRINGYKIFEETLNLKDVKIYDYFEDENGKKKQKLNGKETAIAQAKQEQIKQAFQDWIWSDPNRRERLEKTYNELFNSTKPREYDGSNIIFHGMNPEVTLRKHQLDAVAGILYGNNRLLAHEVGAGKTFEMIAGAMESKALGLCNKSLFVVPNHIIEQFASDFLQLYPAANILVSTKKDFETANRKKFCSRIATGEYDAVIIGHSQFEKIPMSIERQITILKKELKEIMDGIEEAKFVGASFTTKQLMKTKKSIETKLAKLNSAERKDDNVVTFEQLGVDRLFVDEAHYFKNLYLYTKMSNVAGITQTEAQKSSDLYMKCKYLDEITGYKGITFATETPISNSMVELYTMMRYLQMPLLNKLNLQNFDAWASTFGETVTAIELAPEGNGYRAKTRFAKFYNLPELISLFKEAADIKTSDVLNLPVPEAHFENVVVPPSEIQLKLVKDLGERAEKIRGGNVDPRIDNMLKITNDGKKLALDQRLMNELLPDDPNNKSSICANKVYEFYKHYDDIKATQLIFCDLSTPKDDGSFNVYNDIKEKLINKGIPEDEIKFIHEADNEQKKKELFAKVRRGQVRVLIGSTSKMGAGTNCQDRLIAIHHLDCPWRPADLKQREGRIIRQGNKNKEVYIFSYVTEKTFDAYLYQLVENKQKFISQIMTSKTPLRSASDVDETVLNYAEIKSLATGNPLILEKTELDAKVSKLILLKQAHLSQVYELQDRIAKNYPKDIKYQETCIENISKDIEILKEYQQSLGDNFKMELKEKIFTDKKEAGDRLIEIIKDNPNLDDEIKIGKYMDFDMLLGYKKLFKEFYVVLKNNHSYDAYLSTDSLGNITRINNEIERIEGYLTTHQEELDKLKQQLEVAKEEVKKPFLQEEELKEAIKRLKEVDIALKIDDKVPEIMDSNDDKEESQMYKNDYER